MSIPSTIIPMWDTAKYTTKDIIMSNFDTSFTSDKPPPPANYTRKISYWDESNNITQAYLVNDISEIRPEHRLYISLLDAMPMEKTASVAGGAVESARLYAEDNKTVVAYRQDWAGIKNYWLLNIDEFKQT